MDLSSKPSKIYILNFHFSVLWVFGLGTEVPKISSHAVFETNISVIHQCNKNSVRLKTYTILSVQIPKSSKMSRCPSDCCPSPVSPLSFGSPCTPSEICDSPPSPQSVADICSSPYSPASPGSVADICSSPATPGSPMSVSEKCGSPNSPKSPASVPDICDSPCSPQKSCSGLRNLCTGLSGGITLGLNGNGHMKLNGPASLGRSSVPHLGLTNGLSSVPQTNEFQDLYAIHQQLLESYHQEYFRLSK